MIARRFQHDDKKAAARTAKLRSDVLYIIVALTFWLCGFSAYAQQDDLREIAYGPLPEQRLNLCVAEDSKRLRPGVVLLHGGGFIRGDKSDLNLLCRHFSARGFVAATVGYRLAKDRSSAWPAQLIDVQLAVGWLKRHSDEISLDPLRLCAVGLSAGGSLAMFLGVAHAHDPADGRISVPAAEPDVQCVVSNSGITDIGSLTPKTQNALRNSIFIGRDSADRNDVFREASPLYKVDKHSSPMLLICGEHDEVTPISQCAMMEEKLANAGVDFNIIKHEGGHLNSGLDYEQKKQIFLEITDYLKTKLQSQQVH